jgi:Ser/Thr protein kinase RdoA (MazF antagonist)
MSAQNTIIKDGKVYLIDFGCARVGIVPFDEFIWLNFEGKGKNKELAEIFREAYGFSNEIFSRDERTFQILSMLNEFDILRWTVYHGGRDDYRVHTAKKRLKFLL